MPRYTVQDPQSKRTVTFDWNDPSPPTDADMDEIFQSAGSQEPAAPPVHPLNIFDAESGIRKAPGRVMDWVKDNPASVGSIVGGLAAAPFTGGMSIPATMAISGLATGAGAAVGQGVQELQEGSGLKEATSDMLDVGVSNAIGGAIGGAVPNALSRVGRAAYRGALRSGGRMPEEIDKLVETGIREGFNVSRGGYDKAGKLISELSEDVKKLIASAKGSVDPARALRNIEAVRKRAIASGARDADMQAIDAVQEEYTRRYVTNTGGSLSPVNAQTLKSGVMKRVDGKSGYDAGLNPEGVNAQKAFASGLRRQLEEIEPAIAAPNARQAEVIELQKSLLSAEPKVSPRDAALATIYGPKVAVIQAGMRPAGQSIMGRHLANVGDALGGAPRPGVVRPHVDPFPEDRPIQGLKMDLDQLGIPEVSGPRYEPDALDAFDIPAIREVNEPEELWLRKITESLRQEPTLAHLPQLELERLAKEAAANGTYRPQIAAIPSVTASGPLKKSEVQALWQRYQQQR